MNALRSFILLSVLSCGGDRKADARPPQPSVREEPAAQAKPQSESDRESCASHGQDAVECARDPRCFRFFQGGKSGRFEIGGRYVCAPCEDVAKIRALPAGYCQRRLDAGVDAAQ